MDGLLRTVTVAFLAVTLLDGCGGGNSTETSPIGDASAAEQPLDGSSNTAGSSTPLPFTVQGKITYEDRLYGRNTDNSFGFTGSTTYKPVRFATVQLLDQNGTVLANTRSDNNGNYLIAATASGTAKIRVLAGNLTTDGIQLEVRNSAGNIYAATKSFPVVNAATTLDLAIPITRMSGAFNILDVLTAGGEFFHALSNRFAPRLKATWQPGSSNGTYYQSVSGIFVLGGSAMGTGDTDEFDDDVLWHEYGHFLESSAGTFGSPGGQHNLGNTQLDLRLAWSEGWSNFMSGAIKDWLASEGSTALSTSGTPPSLYIDTVDDRAAIAYDFAKVTAIDNRFASNEVAIAKLLWDAHGNFGIQPIWQVFTSQMASMHPVNLEAFWDGWLKSRTPGEEQLRTYLADRDIHYAPDAGEDDDNVSSARLYDAAAMSTLYAGDLAAGKDVDVISFTAEAGKTYRIETYDLHNGADTMVRLFSANDTANPVATNDNLNGQDYYSTSLSHSLNINDGCTLASVVQTSIGPGQGGTYYAVVTESDRLPLSAGHFGSFKLNITENPTQPPVCNQK